MRQETIENYLKTIYNLSSNNTAVVNNQKIADRLSLNPATVTEGLKKLHELKYIVYEKSYGSRLTTSGSKLALDIILANSDKPMRLTVRLGFYVASFAILFGIYVFLRAIFFGFAVTGYASIIFSIWFLSGLILATLGIVGLYIGKIFEGVKNRPVYIIEKETK